MRGHEDIQLRRASWLGPVTGDDDASHVHLQTMWNGNPPIIQHSAEEAVLAVESADIGNDYHNGSDVVKPDWDLRGAVEDLQVLLEVGYGGARQPERPQWTSGTFGTDQRRFTRQKGTRVQIAVLISWLARLVFVSLAVVVGTAALFRAAFVDRTRGARLSLTGVAIAAAMLIYAQLSYPLAWVNAGGRMWMRYGPPGVVFESTTYAFAALLFVLGYAMSIWHTRRPVNSGQLVEIATLGATPDSTTPPTVVLWKVAAFRWIMALTVTFLIGLAAGLVSYEPLQTTMMQWRRAFLGTDSDWHR